MFQAASDDCAVANAEYLPYSFRSDPTSGVEGGFYPTPHREQIIQIARCAGMRSGNDDSIGAAALDCIGRLFIDCPWRKWCCMFHMDIGKDGDVGSQTPAGLDRRPRFALDDSLVGHDRPDMDVHPNEHGADCGSYAERSSGVVSQNVDSDRDGCLTADLQRYRRHRRNGLRADSILVKRDIPEIFNHQSVKPAVFNSVCVCYSLFYNLVERSREAGSARKREQMYHSNQAWQHRVRGKVISGRGRKPVSRPDDCGEKVWYEGRPPAN